MQGDPQVQIRNGRVVSASGTSDHKSDLALCVFRISSYRFGVLCNTILKVFSFNQSVKKFNQSREISTLVHCYTPSETESRVRIPRGVPPILGIPQTSKILFSEIQYMFVQLYQIYLFIIAI